MCISLKFSEDCKMLHYDILKLLRKILRDDMHFYHKSVIQKLYHSFEKCNNNPLLPLFLKKHEKSCLKNCTMLIL